MAGLTHGQIVLKPSGDDAIKILPKTLAVEGKIRAQIAESTWTYVFANPGWRGQADFLIKIPKDGVVTGFAYWYQGEKVVARVAAKERAAMIYKAIVRRQRDPALIEMVGKDTFRVRIFPIDENADLKVELQMVQALEQSPTGGRWPLDLARYGKLESTTVHVVSDSSLRSTWGADGPRAAVLYEAKNQKPANGTITSPLAGKELYVNLLAAKSGGEQGFFTLVATPNRAVKNLRAVISGSVSDVRVLSRTKFAVILAGRYRSGSVGTVTVAGDGYRHTVPFAPGSAIEPNNAASKLWAWTSIQQSKARKQIEDWSIRYTVPSRYTSWIAIPASERERMKKEIAQAEWQVKIDQAMPELGRVGAKSPRGQQIILELKAEGRKLGVETDRWNPNSYEAVNDLGRKWVAEVQRRGENSRLARQYMARIGGYQQLGFDSYYIQLFYNDLAAAIAKKVADDRLRQDRSSVARGRQNSLTRVSEKTGIEPKQYLMQAVSSDIQILAQRIVEAERANKQPKRADVTRLDRLEEISVQPRGLAIRQARANLAAQDIYQLDANLQKIYEKGPLDEEAFRLAKAKRVELEKVVRARGYSTYGFISDLVSNATRAFATAVADGSARVGDDPIADPKLRRAAEILEVDMKPSLASAMDYQYQLALWELGTAELEARRDPARVSRANARIARLEPGVTRKRDWREAFAGRWTEPNPVERTAYVTARHAGKSGEAEKARLDAAMIKEYKQFWGNTRDEYRKLRLARLDALTELDNLDRQTPDPEVLARIKELEARAKELQAKMGDPIVSLVAPNARRVWAVMPDGTVLNLFRLVGTDRWEGRYDVPPGVADGRYAIRVFADGRLADVTYLNVDNTPPTIAVERNDGSVLVRGNEPLARAIAVMPDGNRTPLSRVRDDLFVGSVPVGSRIIATDRAHNRSDQMVFPAALVAASPWASERNVAGFEGDLPLFLNGDGATWLRQVLPYEGGTIARDSLGNLYQNQLPAAYRLPRRQASSIFVGGRSLYVAQMGGYSEFRDGQAIHHFPAELPGVVVTTILAQGNRVWLGTQSRGLAEVDPATDSVRWHDERAGLTDDWITTLTVGDRGQIQIGTFVGGAWELVNGRWTQIPGTAGTSVTGIAGEFVATRQGIFRNGVKVWQHEATALTQIGDVLLVGTRSGIKQISIPLLKETKTP